LENVLKTVINFRFRIQRKFGSWRHEKQHWGKWNWLWICCRFVGCCYLRKQVSMFQMHITFFDFTCFKYNLSETLKSFIVGAANCNNVHELLDCFGCTRF